MRIGEDIFSHRKDFEALLYLFGDREKRIGAPLKIKTIQEIYEFQGYILHN